MKQPGKKSGIFARNSSCFMSAMVAAVIMMFAYAVWEFFPFGENIILRMDLYHQYAPLFAELYERIFGGDSLLYSFTSGLGSGFLGNYFNYLSSPTMLFVLISGHFNIPEAIAAMVLAKASASAFTFTYFAEKITKKKGVAAAAFGLLYAFCGYFVAYYWNIMWLDAVVMFPIVMLGIWYIINERKYLPYILSLSFIMMTNYYMAYMVCMLSVIFFLYFYFSEHSLYEKLHSDIIIKDKYKKTAGVKIFNSRFMTSGFAFAGSSVLAACIAAFALLPVFFILQSSSATNSDFPSTFSSYFSIFDFFANHLACVEPTIRSSGNTVYPNVYCGILTLVLVPLYMFSKKFSIKEKIASTAVAALFFFSFNINILNYIWHGFHFPNDLPYRFSFAYSFFLLFIAYKVFTRIDHISSRDILMSASGVALFCVFVEKIGSANVDQTVVWTSVIFAIVYAVVLVFVKNPRYAKASISILLLTAVCAELLIADTPNYKVTQSKNSYTSSYEDTEAALDIIKEKETDNNSLYRTELASLLTRMDNCWFYYNGVSTFTSMAYEDVAHLQYYLGLFGNEINSYTYNVQTGLYNSMMSLKYIVDNHSYVPTDNYKPVMEGNFLYTKVDTYNDMTIFENNYWLPIAFSVNENADTNWVYYNGDPGGNGDNNNPFAVQNDFFYNASGVADILSPVAGVVSDTRNMENVDESLVNSGKFNIYKENTSDKNNEITFKYEITETQNVYVYVASKDKSVSSVLVSADGFTYNQSIDDAFVLDVGTVQAGTDLYISYSLKDDNVSGSINQYVYGMDQKKFINAYETIVDNGTLDVTENRESYIKGTIKLAADKMLFTSIPYDQGWTVYVDGEKLPAENIVKMGNALMGVKMASGEHTVEFRYTPKGFVLGLGLTGFGVVLLVLLLIFKKKKLLFFSDNCRADIAELGRWRDKAAEAERNEKALEEEQEFSDILEDAKNDEMISSVSDSPWEAALAAAENYARTSVPETQEEVFEESGSDYDEIEEIDEVDEPEFEVDLSEDGVYVEDDAEKSIDEVLDEFEKATDDIEVPKKSKIPVEDKKSAQKKRFNLAVFIIAIVIGVVACVGIMIYAANNSKNEHSETDNVPVVSDVPEILTTEAEEDSSEELTTIATTAPTTSETTTETTTVTTTKAPETTTQARTTEAYNGAYEVYTIRSGDNFYSILRSFGIADTPANVQKLCDFNGISVYSGLSVGQTIKVPLEY